MFDNKLAGLKLDLSSLDFFLWIGVISDSLKTGEKVPEMTRFVEGFSYINCK